MTTKKRKGRPGFAGMTTEQRKELGAQGGKKYKPGTDRMRELARRRWETKNGKTTD